MDNGFWAGVGTGLLLVLLAVLIFPKIDVGEVRILELEEGFVIERCLEYESLHGVTVKCSQYPNDTPFTAKPPQVFTTIMEARAAKDKWEKELKDEERRKEKRYVE